MQAKTIRQRPERNRIEPEPTRGLQRGREEAEKEQVGSINVEADTNGGYDVGTGRTKET